MTRCNFTILPNEFNAIAAKAKLNATDIRVYFALASHVRSTATVFPSIGRLAELACVTQPTHVSRSIQRLEKAGLVTHTRQRNAKGEWDSATYVLPHLEPVTKSGQWTSDQIWSVDAATSDQIWSQPVTRSGQLNRTIEEEQDSPPLPSGESPPQGGDTPSSKVDAVQRFRRIGEQIANTDREAERSAEVRG